MSDKFQLPASIICEAVAATINLQFVGQAAAHFSI
jgi:hypothetical protein